MRKGQPRALCAPLCLQAGAWLSSGSSQGVSELSMPSFTWPSLLILPPCSPVQEPLPTAPGNWRGSNAVGTVLAKPKGLCAPLGIAFTKETRSDPDTAWHLTLSCQERLFPLHFSYFWPFPGLCCQQSGGLVSCHCSGVVAVCLALSRCSSARMSQWCISWCLAKARVQPAPQCSRRKILPKPWP